jgi:hypothetical protein
MDEDTPKLPVMRELPAQKHRVTKIQRRGNFLDLGDVVAPGVPAAFCNLPDGAPLNRLGVARWLISWSRLKRGMAPRAEGPSVESPGRSAA